MTGGLASGGWATGACPANFCLDRRGSRTSPSAPGPEPLDGAFTDETLAGILAKRSAPVKAVLLDQRAVAGIGNLYADEALHHAGVHPLRLGSSLKKGEGARRRG